MKINYLLIKRYFFKGNYVLIGDISKIEIVDRSYKDPLIFLGFHYK